MQSLINDTGLASPAARPARVGTTLHPDSVVGPWRVEYELGRGGMGCVYAVVHEVIGKRAAMKVIHQHMFTPAYTAERFLLEARAVNVVTHPNIVDIFESGTLDDGRPYLIMERLHGKTLGDRLEEGRIPPVEVIDYLLPLCDALAAAHGAGVVHRDIKLDNVFVVDCQGTTSFGGTYGTVVKLLDWGIASVASVDGDNSFRDMLVGTPRYVAPEQARGEPASPPSDIYSLGVVAYELFLEAPPFTAESAAEVLAMHLSDPPPPPRDVWPQIPSALEDLLMDMLAKSPALRPTIEQVAEQLRAIRAYLVTRARPSDQVAAVFAEGSGPHVREAFERGATALSTELPRRRRRWALASVVCALVALGAGARLVTTRASAAAPASVAAEVPAPTPVAMAVNAPAGVSEVKSVAPPVTTTPVSTRSTARPVRRGPISRAGADSHARAARDSGRLAPAARPASRRIHPDDTIDPY